MVSKAERRRRIFLTARTIFTGPNSRIRDRKTISAVVAQHEDHFKQCNAAFAKNIVVDVINSLLEHGVFESELKAKLSFPELYQVSALRSLQHDASEKNAAKSEAEAIETLSQQDSDIGQPDLDDAYDDNGTGKGTFEVTWFLLKS